MLKCRIAAENVDLISLLDSSSIEFTNKLIFIWLLFNLLV